MKSEKKSKPISLSTIVETHKILDWLKENGNYLAQIGNLKMKYDGEIEDTLLGKREIFIIERKIK